ncbi:hypothetical protein BCR42DRAFT_315860 [Absidia repens]|uniref:Uncharacterized protein n=1 Tax=Absidia repens TaxID=90262 RepID=A0A1X2J1P9_9FUNG|nr:hypothetical protein BCR42DRAFT_315860 [Absidia repens]
MLSDAYLQECSELSIMIKYWGFVFEQCLGYSKDVFLQWGDTVSSHSVDIGTTAKLDIRIIIIGDNNARIEAATGEFASASATTKSKLFADRLKSVLVSKVLLNHALSKMKHIPEDAIKTIRIPAIQVMGLSCCVYSLSLIDKGVYCLEHVCAFEYPRTIQQIKQGVLGTLIQGMVMMRDLEDAIEQYGRTTRNKMMEVLETNKRTASKKADLNDWTTTMISFSDDGQDTSDNNSDNTSEEDSDDDAVDDHSNYSSNMDNTPEQDEDDSGEDGNSNHDSI